MAFSKNVLRAICILITGLASIKSQTSYTETEIYTSGSTASQTSNVSTTTGASSNDPLKGFKIVCLFNNMKYYKEGFTPAMIDPTLCTHVNYEFAILDDMTYEMMTGEPDLDVHENFYQV
ncbi:putative chitinase 3, partial [Stegodyphus mimosarum]